MGTDYWNGFLAGAMVCAFIGLVFLWIWRFYKAWLKTWQALNKPQVVIHTTGQTPMQIYRAAMRARLRMTCLQSLVAIGIVGILMVWKPEIVRWFWDMVIGMFDLLVG